MRRPRMTTRQWLVAVAIAACVLGGIVWRIRYPGRAFDASAWNDPARINEGVRQPMADRLIAQGSLEGMTRAEVVRMLGEPMPLAPPGWDLTYYIGPERGFLGIDSESLVIRLGPDGRVVALGIYTD